MLFRTLSSIFGTLSLTTALFACSSDAGEQPGAAGSPGIGGLSGVTAGAAGKGGSGGSSGSGGSGGSGGTPTGSGGSSVGVSGSSGTNLGGGSATGGSSTATGGSGAATGGNASGGGATGGSASGGAGSGGGAMGTACPADATFCSGFEDAALPAGAVYKVNVAPGEWTRDFAVDTSVMRGGKSSLKVKSGSDTGTSGSAYQMLAVPAPTGAFWARFYIRQADLDIGGVDHNVFAGASSSDEPNAAGTIEFAEDVGVAFNTSDAVRWPMNYGRINGNPMPFTLPKGMWHCIEISFDGTARAQKLYVNGQLQIDATDYPSTVSSPLKTFKFGFNKLHGPARSVWYDDVAVGPTRPGCL